MRGRIITNKAEPDFVTAGIKVFSGDDFTHITGVVPCRQFLSGKKHQRSFHPSYIAHEFVVFNTIIIGETVFFSTGYSFGAPNGNPSTLPSIYTCIGPILYMLL